MLRRLALIGRIGLLAALVSSTVSAAPAPTKVKIMVAGIDKQIYLPAKLAERIGAFKEEGVDVELFNSTSGSQAATALLAREVQASVGFYDHTIDLQAKGKFVTDIVQLAAAPGEVELVKASEAAKYSNPSQWKGQSLGVTGLGSATDFITRALAVRAGLRPNDVTLIPVGAGDTFITSMQQGKIVAGMTTEPTVSRAIKDGLAKIAIDLRTPESTRAALGGDYPAACVYVDSGWLNENHETAQKVANAFIRALKFIRDHTAEEIADKMPVDYYAGDKALYVQGLRDGKAQWSPTGRMPVGAPASVLKLLKTFNPALKDKQIDIGKTYTTEFAQKASAGP